MSLGSNPRRRFRISERRRMNLWRKGAEKPGWDPGDPGIRGERMKVAIYPRVAISLAVRELEAKGSRSGSEASGSGDNSILCYSSGCFVFSPMQRCLDPDSRNLAEERRVSSVPSSTCLVTGDRDGQKCGSHLACPPRLKTATNNRVGEEWGCRRIWFHRTSSDLWCVFWHDQIVLSLLYNA